MRIAIIGAGHVGGTLGRRWAASGTAGHTVTFGIRPGDELDAQLGEFIDGSGGAARAASVADAARASEVVAFAVPWKAARDAVQSAGSLSGKIVIDCTNPFAPGLTGLDVPDGGSGAEAMASWAPGARVVKAFNTTGFNIMANPAFPEGPATMFYCGDDAPAKRTVHGLAAELGFDPIDAGPLARARVLENMALLWVSLAMGGVSGGAELGRDIAFRLARRKSAAA
ncbi:MAG TPA: NADPH-dependent F420 reductase [Gemmatimonadaceae bacterium]|nr:NADPH-dependent F420 reductase [Gemmatimonadaceae bacterium]